MSKKKKQANSPKTEQEWFQFNLKKLNFLYGIGFETDIAKPIHEQDPEDPTVVSTRFVNLEQKFSNAEMLKAMDGFPNENYHCNLFTTEDVIAIWCETKLSYVLLDFQNSFSMEVPFPDGTEYCYLFRYDDFMFNKLDELFCENNIPMWVDSSVNIFFPKANMPKVTIPKDKDGIFTLQSLPYMTRTQFEQIKTVTELLANNKGYQFQINTGTKYRIPNVILDDLSYPDLTVNDKKVLEKVLLTITNSTFAITLSTTTPFRISVKDFCKDLKLSRTNEPKEVLIKKCFVNLCKYNLVDECRFDKETGMMTIFATALCEKIRHQNMQRQFGFYDDVPKNRQSAVISAWLDYLYMITHFTRQNKILKASLDTVLTKLHLQKLVQGSRLKEIAVTMNKLLAASNAYGLTTGKCEFTSELVKTLLDDEHKSDLKKYITLVCENEKKEEKKKENNGGNDNVTL